jgi:hypothetical protein
VLGAGCKVQGAGCRVQGAGAGCRQKAVGGRRKGWFAVSYTCLLKIIHRLKKGSSM